MCYCLKPLHKIRINKRKDKFIFLNKVLRTETMNILRGQSALASVANHSSAVASTEHWRTALLLPKVHLSL